MSHEAIIGEHDRKKLDGLMRFAHGVLTARDKVQMMMASTRLGVYHEGDVATLPGVHLDEEDGAWLRLDRLRETKPPAPANYVAEFMSSKGTDPEGRPEVLPAISKEAAIEEASDLVEAGLLRPENVHPIIERGVEVSNRVRVTLLAEDCPEMLRDFETWRDGAWADWALTERPVRNSIRFYQSLFQHHSAIHAAESVPPELVWGIGIGRWRTGNDVIDMPLLEQLVDIEVEDGGAIAIRPRDLSPSLSLKPYLQIEVPGAANLQNQLKDALATVLMGDAEFSPFNPSGWEHILATATAQLSASASHIRRADLAAGVKLQPIRAQLAITSSWVIYGRPRSAEARSQDIEALRRALADPETPIPKSIKGFAAPEPDKPQDATDHFGLSTSVLAAGGVENFWTPPAASSTKLTIVTNAKATDAHRARFFPLPFNEAQSDIIDLLDDPENHVVTVTGPPGTGKTHTIANIVSHYMAIGKRALVTARTPEAIAAVREKLPESLRNLVIASVGTDRESAQQLRDAVQELSDEVIGLNVADSDTRRRQLEAAIVACDEEAQRADQELAEIARKNLAPLTWNGEKRSAMDLVVVLEESAAMHGWFTDRPDNEPPAQLSDTLHRLRQMLPRLAPDIAYAGASLPELADLPTTPDLIAAHDRERAWNTREVPDYSRAPTMARDTIDADRKAKALLDELEDCAQTIALLAEHQKRIVARLVCGETADGIGETAFQQATSYMAGFRHAGEAAAVRFNLGRTAIQELLAAAERGAAGRKPIPVTSRLLKSTLKKTVESVTIDGRKPAGASQWLIVHAACKLHAERARIEAALAPLHTSQLLPRLPMTGWEIAHYLAQTRSEIEQALVLAPRLATSRRELEALFPVGLDFDVFCRKLRVKDAIDALCANLPDGYQAPAALTALDTLAGASDLPLFKTIRELRARLGSDDIGHQDIVALRGELTKEIHRLAALEPDLAKLGEDLETVASAGAPEWAARLEADPLDAADLIPEGWEPAWAWGMIKHRVDRIVALGNGDEHRKAKAEALCRRGKLFEELVRARTLLGLHQRMTGRVKRALSAFTQAIARIGKGTGKSAPRFRLAAQEAAKEASSAAPVWIMPEYKIPEQLPPIIADFDLVILDEASQSDITALAALARGKSILVVGDEEQVSPSNVAIPIQRINALRADCLTGLPNAKLIDENTSIFEIAMRMHPDTHVVLREHFRCVAPIIQFSTQFYANRLIPLRVPKASERFDPPLVDVYIKGAERQGQTNASEARYIVEEIARVIADPAHKGRDIGVISLIGSEQAHKIERMLIDHPRIGTDAITVHHIICGDARTMQGQERSIVFLSMVATPGNAHAQTKKADQQRVNVAMSRARDRLYLVRSVSLDDLNPTDIKAKVLQHLQDPMPEGRSAISSGTSDDLFAKCQSGFEREVLGLLLEANYRVRPQVKVSAFSIDLVIEGAEDRRLAVELDGDPHHGPEVWKKDMARQAALERAGWTFWRVFGSQWNAQKAYWWQDLNDTLTRMGIEPIGMGELDGRFTEFRTADPFQADPGVSSEDAAAAQGPPAAGQRTPANMDGSEDQPADEARATPTLSGGESMTAAAATPATASAEACRTKLPDTSGRFFTEEQYQASKSHFLNAWQATKAAGGSIDDFLKAVLERLRAVFGDEGQQHRKALKAMVRRFALEQRDIERGSIAEPGEQPTSTVTEGQTVGNQEPARVGNARAGSQDVQPAAPQGRDGVTSPGEGGRSGGNVRSDDGERAPVRQRPSEAIASPGSRGASVRSTDGVTPRESMKAAAAKGSGEISWTDAKDYKDNGQGVGNPIDRQEPEDVTVDLDPDTFHERGTWAQTSTSRVMRAPTRPGFNEGRDALPAPDSSRFYDPSYRPQIRAMVAAYVDAEGPITFKRLSDRVARAHGFQRTGKQISGVIWAASQRLRQYVATSDGHKVFWPENVEPLAEVPFRGLMLNGERREWREVPHPEKIWLVRKASVDDDEDDLARAIADRIGIGRVTTHFRAEIAELKRQLES